MGIANASLLDESAMNAEGGNVFSKTVGGFTTGQTISYACKFAITGGQVVTKYFQYVVGEDCEDPKEIPTITFSDVTKTVGDAAFKLTASSNSSGAFTYTVDNTAIATVSGNTAIIVGPGATTVTAFQAEDDNYVAYSATMTLTINTANTNTDEPLLIYPNPVSTSINFSGLSSENPIIKIELLSNSGQAVQVKGGNLDQLDVQHLSTGIYYINIYLQDGTLISRAFIKK